MKYRALRRLKHKLEAIDQQLETGSNQYEDFIYNWEDKPTTATKLLKRAIADVDTSVKRKDVIDLTALELTHEEFRILTQMIVHDDAPGRVSLTSGQTTKGGQIHHAMTTLNAKLQACKPQQ